LREQVLAIYQRLYSGDHPDIFRVLDSLAEDLRMLGEPTRARDVDEQAVAMRQRLAERDAPTP
jgi:hypothetical protein